MGLIMKNGIQYPGVGNGEGSGLEISQLDDVKITPPLENGDKLVYDKEKGKWTNTTKYHNYSTEEQVVGTWIDGKPIYEKTFNNLQLPNRADYLIDLSSLNIENVINAYGLCHRLANDGGSFDYNLPFFESTGLYVNMRYNKNPKNYSIWCSDSSGTYTANLTIQYTKTTD